MTTRHSVNVTPLGYVNLRRLMLQESSILVTDHIKRFLVASSKAHGGTVTEDTDLTNLEVEITVLHQEKPIVGLLIDHDKP